MVSVLGALVLSLLRYRINAEAPKIPLNWPIATMCGALVLFLKDRSLRKELDHVGAELFVPEGGNPISQARGRGCVSLRGHK